MAPQTTSLLPWAWQRGSAGAMLLALFHYANSAVQKFAMDGFNGLVHKGNSQVVDLTVKELFDSEQIPIVVFFVLHLELNHLIFN